MKRKIIIGSLLLATISLSSCDSFLSEVPDNRTQIDTPIKAAELIATAYPQGTMAVLGETMSDNAFDSGRITYTNTTNTENYNWEIVRDENQDTPTHYWEACYKAIASANAGIEALDKFIAENEKTNKSTKDLYSIKGEALVARAYAHFMLVNLWGKTYDPNDMSSLGVPYVFTPETTLLPDYKRNTVAEVYSFIEEDLLNGLDYLSGVHLKEEVAKYHFNVEAARAFAARFFLFKGEWNKVIEYSSDVSSPRGLLRDMKSYSKMDENEHYTRYTNPTETTNLLVGTVPSTMKRTLGLQRFNFDNDIANSILFGPNTNPMGGTWNFLRYSYTATKGLYMPRYSEFFKITDPTNMTGFPYVNQVIFSNDLLFLDRMEALVMENRFEEALSGLSYFFAERTEGTPQKPSLTLADIKDFTATMTENFNPFYSLSADQKSFIKVISDARRRESYSDGSRWFDIRRYNLEIVHRSIERGDNVLEVGDYRRELQIPLMAISKGLEANPR